MTAQGVTVHRLLKLPTRSKPEGDWRKVAFLDSNLPQRGWIVAPEPKGQALSGSRMDLVLRSFAEHGHGGAYGRV